MRNEPRLYGFYPEKDLFPKSGTYRLPEDFLPSSEFRRFRPEDVLILSGFAEGKADRACVSFESDTYDPCVVLMKRTAEGIFLLRLRSMAAVSDPERLGRLTDLLISLASAENARTDTEGAFFLPDEARPAFCRFFGNGKESVTAREVTLFCSAVSALQCVLPVFEETIDRDYPLVPNTETCRFWEYYLTCLSAMLRVAKRSESRVLKISSGFEPKDGHFRFSFEAGGSRNDALFLVRTAEKLRQRLPASRYGSFLPDSGWRIETGCREGVTAMTLHAAPYVRPVMHTPLPVTLRPAYLSSLPAFAEIFGEFL